jgi:hypothetical protein
VSIKDFVITNVEPQIVEAAIRAKIPVEKGLFFNVEYQFLFYI